MVIACWTLFDACAFSDCGLKASESFGKSVVAVEVEPEPEDVILASLFYDLVGEG